MNVLFTRLPESSSVFATAADDAAVTCGPL